MADFEGTPPFVGKICHTVFDPSPESTRRDERERLVSLNDVRVMRTHCFDFGSFVGENG